MYCFIDLFDQSTFNKIINKNANISNGNHWPTLVDPVLAATYSYFVTESGICLKQGVPTFLNKYTKFQ